MDIQALITKVQQALKKDNPSLVVDGKAGPQTWAAIARAILPPATGLEEPLAGDVDARSGRMIATLLPQVQDIARALIVACRQRGIDCRIISATRTREEQDRLYAQGRTTKGPIVTNARGGYSNHNFGIAFDVGLFAGNRYLEESSLYKVVGALGQELGLEWGGSWKSIVDEPHFQLRPAWAKGMSEREMLAQFRNGRAF
jgi:peptidoglycan L-alanyl-D-glutamate endopeptidase CwlK